MVKISLTRSIAQLIASWLNRYTQKEGLALEKMTIGIEIFLNNISKLIVVYVLAIVLGVIWQTLAVNIAFMVIKRCSFGVHALSNTVCTLVCVVAFVAVPWFTYGMGIGNIAVACIFAYVIAVLYRYAPADTKRRPLVGVNTRARLKRNAVISGLVLMGAALLIPDGSIKLMLALGAVFQTVAILPITYKILKRSEKNYEKYELAK